MALCPWCEKPLKVADRVYRNADTYKKTVVSKAECCGNAVSIRSINTFQILPVLDRKEDDWGEKIKQPPCEQPKDNQ